jgi:hypothetical protein
VAALVVAALAAVKGGHRPAAAAAAQDFLAQRAALPRRALAGAGVVGRQPPLVGQVPLPADVAGVVVLDHHRPLGARQLGYGGGDRAVRPHRPAGAVAAEHIRARVAGDAKHAECPRMGQLPPAQLARPGPAVGALREAPALEGADHAVGRAGPLERPEYLGDRGPDLLVGVDDRLAVLVVDVADRQRKPQLAALRRRTLGALQARADDVQLGLRHLRLQRQQQPVVEVLEVIDTVGVDHQRVGQRAKLKQPLRLGARAGQPGDLQLEDRADLAQTHPGDQLLAPLPRLRVREPAGEPQIAVDDRDPLRLPAEPGGLLGERVLALGRAEVLAHLPRRGLAQIRSPSAPGASS